MRKSISLMVIIITVLLAGGCVTQTPTTTPTPPTETPQTKTQATEVTVPQLELTIPDIETKPLPQTPTTTNDGNFKITIDDYTFSNSALEIKKGNTVTWLNNDSIIHTVVSDTEKGLSSPKLNKGDSYSYTFNKSGTYVYYCSLHPLVKARIIVK